MQPRMRTASPA